MSRWLMIGFSKGFLSQLQIPPGSVTVLEEPDVWRKKNLVADLAGFPMVDQVLLGEYMESDSFWPLVRAANDAEPFAAVVPGLEYAVPAAAAAAERLGLPGATLPAATALREKLRLREVSGSAGIPNPRWTEVHGPEDVQAFAAGGAVVVKPSGRQASLGVLRLDAGASIERAWAEVARARETTQVPDRPLTSRFLAEELLDGREYSVEALVSDGKVCFLNVTEKLVLPGPHPVELGHLVPAPLPDDSMRVFHERMRLLVETVGFRNGILHAEWMQTADRGPVLIECAGRVPGDHILELVGLAYGVDIFGSLVDLLHGRPPALPSHPLQAACIRFVTAPPGRVASVGSAEDTRHLDGVVTAELAVGPGDHVGPCRSSWDRLGHVIAVGCTPAEAQARAMAGVAALQVVTLA